MRPLLGVLLTACTGTLPTDDTKIAGDTATSGLGCTTTGDGGFDPIAQCAAGVCTPVTYPDAEAVYGAPAACTSDANTSNCFWPAIGINLTFTDCDQDGAPDGTDASCEMTLQELRVSAPYTGVSVDGLGLNQSRACWERVLGPGTDIGDGGGDVILMWYSVAGDASHTLEVDFYSDVAGAVSMYWSG